MMRSPWGGEMMVLLLPTLVLAAKAVTAVADVCPANHTDIRVTQKIDQPRLDFSKSSAELKAMKFSQPVSDLGFAEMTGLTEHSIAVDSEIRIASSGSAGSESGGTPLCVWPTVVTVTLSTAPTIYIASDDGDCRHAVALAHEMRHAAVDRDIIAGYIPIFRQRLASMVDVMTAAAPEATLDIDARRSRIEEKINAMIAVTSEVMNANQVARQREVDSPEEYRRRSNACPMVTFNPVQPRSGGARSPGT
jgi:hypothetical protein